MTNELSKSNQGGKDLSTNARPKILDEAYNSLSAEEKTKLLSTAAQYALEQEVKDREAARRFQSSGVEMDRHVDFVKQHEQYRSDFTVNSEFKTASGKTTVRVQKTTNMSYIVVAVVIAVIFFVVFSK